MFKNYFYVFDCFIFIGFKNQMRSRIGNILIITQSSIFNMGSFENFQKARISQKLSGKANKEIVSFNNLPHS